MRYSVASSTVCAYDWKAARVKVMSAALMTAALAGFRVGSMACDRPCSRRTSACSCACGTLKRVRARASHPAGASTSTMRGRVRRAVSRERPATCAIKSGSTPTCQSYASSSRRSASLTRGCVRTRPFTPRFTSAAAHRSRYTDSHTPVQ